MVSYWVANQLALTKTRLSTSLIPKTSPKIDFGPKQTQQK